MIYSINPIYVATAGVPFYASPPLVEFAAFNSSVEMVLSGALTVDADFEADLAFGVQFTAALDNDSTIQGALAVPMLFTGALSISSDVTAINALITAVFTGSLATDAGEVVGAVVLNTTTGGIAEYDYAFNSMFVFDGVPYGCGEAGIFALNGAPDTVSWRVTTPTTDLGAVTIKYVPDAQMESRLVTGIYIDETVDEQTLVKDRLIPCDTRTGIHARRVQLPIGIKGTRWGFSLHGLGDTTIKTLQFTPKYSKRTQ